MSDAVYNFAIESMRRMPRNCRSSLARDTFGSFVNRSTRHTSGMDAEGLS